MRAQGHQEQLAKVTMTDSRTKTSADGNGPYRAFTVHYACTCGNLFQEEL